MYNLEDRAGLIDENDTRHSFLSDIPNLQHQHRSVIAQRHAWKLKLERREERERMERGEATEKGRKSSTGKGKRSEDKNKEQEKE